MNMKYATFYHFIKFFGIRHEIRDKKYNCARVEPDLIPLSDDVREDSFHQPRKKDLNSLENLRLQTLN